ncbi:MAG: zf-TFIIB domain-containing protein [Deltaproteobacteria bacterium]|nr:zf-TFIIB domain-containing protein [Deltaproteobacteria bacterium]
MARFYTSCPTCHTRLRTLGTGGDLIGLPPTRSERYYRCPACAGTWTLLLVPNALAVGIPVGVPSATAR